MNVVIKTITCLWCRKILILRCDLPTDQQFVARAMTPRIVGLWGFASTHGWQKVKNGDCFSAYVTTNGNNHADGNMSAQDTFVELEIFRVG